MAFDLNLKAVSDEFPSVRSLPHVKKGIETDKVSAKSPFLISRL